MGEGGGVLTCLCGCAVVCMCVTGRTAVGHVRDCVPAVPRRPGPQGGPAEGHRPGLRERRLQHTGQPPTTHPLPPHMTHRRAQAREGGTRVDVCLTWVGVGARGAAGPQAYAERCERVPPRRGGRPQCRGGRQDDTTALPRDHARRPQASRSGRAHEQKWPIH